MTTSNANKNMKTFFVQAPVGIPTGDGGLEIPNRVFLGGIATETTELELENFFQEYGTIKDVRIVTDRFTGENKGYGFVTFDDNEGISRLLAKRSITMNGKKLRIRKAIRRNGSQFIDCNAVESNAFLAQCQPAEQYIMVTQPQNTAPASSYYTQVAYQPCAISNYSVPVNSMQYTPVQQQLQQPLQTMYYVPYVNSPPMQVPMATNMMQQMQIS